MNNGTKLVRDCVAGEFVRLYSENSMQSTKVMKDGEVLSVHGGKAPGDALVFVYPR